jgi:hypothetical protein
MRRRQAVAASSETPVPCPTFITVGPRLGDTGIFGFVAVRCGHAPQAGAADNGVVWRRNDLGLVGHVGFGQRNCAFLRMSPRFPEESNWMAALPAVKMGDAELSRPA